MEAHILHNFFAKYPQKFSVMTALKAIDKEIECAKKAHKHDKESKEYLHHLKQCAMMIADLYAELGESADNY